ncbi:MAG: hypothetical protein ACTSP4_09360 [Candidatus Hodarchaeales archaeon]
MVTSIQLKEPTKQDLFEIKNRLEMIYNSPLSYDDVIKHLIETSQLKTTSKRSLKAFRGILGPDGKKIFRQMREEELIGNPKKL